MYKEEHTHNPVGKINSVAKPVLWPNLKNLSGGLNLSRGLHMVGST